MQRLILNPTALAEWQALINDASLANNTNLNEDLESYLVFLLMRFINSANLANTIIALDLLESMNKTGKQQQQSLRDVGDSCLLFAGLFPGYARKRRVQISYYVNVGKTAYQKLHDLNDKTNHTLFSKLNNEFVTLMDVLQKTRELNSSLPSIDLLQADEIWRDLGSKHALETLQKFTKSIPMPVVTRHKH